MTAFKFLLLLTLLAPSPAKAAETDLGDREWIHLLHDQPLYFLMGPPNTKVQLSFKAKIIASSDFYFAYTQRIFWDLFEKSSPFRDVNYNPSLFYRFHLGDGQETLLDIIGYEHESNGKGGNDSRSWNRTGARLQKVYTFEDKKKLIMNMRAWVPFIIDRPNENIAEYRGLYEINFTLSNFLGKYFDLNDLNFRFFPGGKTRLNPFQGGRELTLRLHGNSDAFLANAVFQIFQGYGENMLEYDESIWGFRAGFGI